MRYYMEKVIDCQGLACPQPVINTKKYFDSISEGEAIVVADNETAKNNISKFAQSSGFQFSVEDKTGLFYIRIKKESMQSKTHDNEETFTLVISSNLLGVGDPKLGAALMKSYLYAFSESNKIPEDIIFLNSGVFLTAEGSECLGTIQKLQECGAAISSCGTCLDFYNLKEKLLIGDVTNMYTIIEKMNNSSKTIKI